MEDQQQVEQFLKHVLVIFEVDSILLLVPFSLTLRKRIAYKDLQGFFDTPVSRPSAVSIPHGLYRKAGSLLSHRARIKMSAGLL